MMAARAVSRMAPLPASVARHARTPRSARRCSAPSRKISTTPIIRPAASRIGAALSSMGRSDPSLATRIVWFASPTTVRSPRPPPPVPLLIPLLLGPPPLEDDGGLVGPHAQEQSLLLGRECGVAGAGDE